MASGKLSPTHTILSGNISSSSQQSMKGTTTGGSSGTADHRRLTNRDASDQHPITAISGLQDALATKATKADLIEIRAQLADKKAKGLYYDLDKRFAKKSF